nr:hypothetical protein Iba_scaffold8881CG0270 [Ipomoea batatas]GME15516.1 hypothetical protein Iba_scaffold16274CG0020 [Ipomoea batatas]
MAVDGQRGRHPGVRSTSTLGTLGTVRASVLSSKFKRQSYRDAPSTAVRDALGVAAAGVTSRVSARLRSVQ